MQRWIPQPLLIHPWELLIAGLCLLSGLPLALGAPSPNSINQALPELLVRVWGATLASSGAAVTSGLVLPYIRPHLATVGLRVERGGLALLAAAASVFSIAIIVAAGWRGALPAATYLMFAAACGIRTVVLVLTERGLAHGR